MPIKSIWVRILLLFLVLDTGYSFVQHYHQKLDGDVVGIVLPRDNNKEVLKDPFGLSVLLENKSYAGTNRYFAHKFMYEYLRNAPIVLQYIVQPITSVYLSAAIIKILLQALLICLLAIFITGKCGFRSKKFIIAMVLVAPVFQATGYHEYFGIIDSSITYALFYAVGNALIMFFFLPFVLKYIHKKNLKFGVPLYAVLIVLSVVIAFHSPTNSGFILIMCSIVLFYYFSNGFKSLDKNSILNRIVKGLQQIPRPIFVVFVIICFISLYSFYIGTFNSENEWTDVSIKDRYIRLLKGLGQVLTFKIGQFLFFTVLGINIVLVYMSSKGEERSRLLNIATLLLLFSVLYTFLLPLGGFREYRPFIVRRDTFMPVMLCLLVLYGMSTIYLIKYLKSWYRKFHFGLIGLLLIVLTVADDYHPEKHNCEKEMLNLISLSNEKDIVLPGKCSVLSWNTKFTFEASEGAASLLQHWNIIDEPKRFKFEN